MGIDVSADEISKNVFDNFKKITPALIAIAIISGLLLFLPEEFLAKMSLDNMPDIAKRVIGIVFLLSSVITVVILFFSVINIISKGYKHKRFRKDRKKKYERLSDQQKLIIKEMLQSPNKAIQLDSNSGDVIYLQTHLFIFQPTQITSVDYDNEMILTYTPHPWLIDLYNEQPELFK